MAGQSKKSKKHDIKRKSPQNSRYKLERRHEKSHIRRIIRHLGRYGRDGVAWAALTKYKTAAGIK